MKRQTWYFLTGLLLTACVCVDIAWWIVDCSETATFEQAKENWLNRFPETIRNATAITGLNILLTAISTVAFSKARKDPRLALPSRIGLGIAGVLLVWQLFSLS